MASTAAAQKPLEELQQLDEIWVRGKSLADSIAEAEDDFFRLYNKLNRKNAYDISCGYVRLDRDSMVMTRTCVPAFLADITYSTYTPSTGCTVSAAGWSDFAPAAPSICTVYGSLAYQGSRVSWPGSGPAAWAGQPPVAYTSPLVAAQVREQANARRQQYYRNVMKVIYSDQRLLERAEALAPLYRELESTRERFVKVKAEGGTLSPSAGRKAARHAANPNPRFR